MAKRVLMVLTSHDNMGISDKKTGNWFDEVATPYYTFKEHGIEVVMASPKGGAAPIDPFSHDDAFTTDNTRRFEDDPAAQRAVANTAKLSEINTRDFYGAFFPGGYGQLWDLASDSLAIRMIEEMIEAETPVAMVCHAPAILRDAKKPNGEPLVAGKDVTGFTDAEDTELDLSRHLLTCPIMSRKPYDVTKKRCSRGCYGLLWSHGIPGVTSFLATPRTPTGG